MTISYHWRGDVTVVSHGHTAHSVIHSAGVHVHWSLRAVALLDLDSHYSVARQVHQLRQCITLTLQEYIKWNKALGLSLTLIVCTC
jgi:hypothetical protein